jgi:endogenous inhibitor of DNA gyrase (YacG/DUF329 family)
MFCPICKKEVAEPSEGQKSYYPFCSERCKLIDLGRWLGGRYQVPVVDTDEAHDGEVDDSGQNRLNKR